MTKKSPPLDLTEKIVKVVREASLLLLVGYLAWFLVPFIPRWAAKLADSQISEINLAGGVTLKLTASTEGLQSAQQQISTLQQKNDELTRLLADAKTKAEDPDLKKRLSELESENSALKKQSLTVQAKISSTIDSNISAVERVASALDTSPSRPEKHYYVIAMTSSSRQDISAEIQRVKRRVSAAGQNFESMFPLIETYPPSDGATYTLLISGKSLPFAQASELKQKAIAAGFSDSTWLWQSDVGYFSGKPR